MSYFIFKLNTNFLFGRRRNAKELFLDKPNLKGVLFGRFQNNFQKLSQTFNYLEFFLINF